MIGKIITLNTESGSGLILAENGLEVQFDLWAVLAYDVAYLVVGRLLRFDIEKKDGRRRRALKIRAHWNAISEVRPPKPPRFLYLGFEQ